MKRSVILLGIVGLLLASFSSEKEVHDYLSVGKTISLGGEEYFLKWSSNPVPNDFKQEYLKEGEELETYEKMVMVESIKGALTVRQAVQAKKQELDRWKNQNPFVHYTVNELDKETILQFVVNSGNIFEWNVYRYRQEQNHSDNYLVLYCFSYRNYTKSAEDVEAFLHDVKECRVEVTRQLEHLTLPAVAIK